MNSINLGKKGIRRLEAVDRLLANDYFGNLSSGHKFSFGYCKHKREDDYNLAFVLYEQLSVSELDAKEPKFQRPVYEGDVLSFVQTTQTALVELQKAQLRHRVYMAVKGHAEREIARQRSRR